MNCCGTAIVFLLLVACVAHARRPQQDRRPRTTTASASTATSQPGGSNGSGDADAGATSKQAGQPLAVSTRRRLCVRGRGCITLIGGQKESTNQNARDVKHSSKSPLRPLGGRRRITTRTSPTPTTTVTTTVTTTTSRVAGGVDVHGPRGKWIAAGGGCSAKLSCPIGKCCVNVIIGGLAQSMCQDLARQGEYCSADGLQPPYARFCPCVGGSLCKPLVPHSPGGCVSHSVGVCQAA